MQSLETRGGELELHRRIVEEAPCGVVRIAKDGVVVAANRVARRMLGPRDAAGSAQRLTEWASDAADLNGEPCAADELPFARILVTAEPEGPRTIGVRDAEGRVAWVTVHAIPNHDANGVFDGAIVFLDAAECLRVHQEPMRCDEAWRSLAANLADYVTVADRAGRILWTNWLDPPLEEARVIGTLLEERLDPRARPALRTAFDEVVSTGRRVHAEIHCADPNGKDAWFDVTLVPLLEGESVERVLAVARDVTDRKCDEQAVVASEQRWRTLVESLPDIVLVLDRERRILAANIPSVEIGGLPLIGTLADAFVDESTIEEFRSNFAKALRTGEPVRYEIRSSEAANMSRWYDAILAPVKSGGAIDRLLVVTRDSTSQRAMVASLAEKERLASVGMVASSVAHEIMNPLTYVLANLDLALNQSREAAHSFRQALAAAREGAERMQQIVWDLRSLGRAGSEELLYVDARSVLETALRLSGPEVGRTATITLDLQEVPSVCVSESRLCQVFINLLVNAAQSMESTPPEEREIHVCTRYDEPTSLVAIAISDRGSGIAPFAHGRLFEPFFTTKRSGTGLGLSIARDIVTRMGGRIEFESTQGSGATFTVWLPTMRTEREAKDCKAEEGMA